VCPWSIDVARGACVPETPSAAREHIADGIRINIVSPGSVDTTMSLLPGETVAGRTERVRNAVPIGWVMTDAVANSVLWLASDDASFTVGHNLVLDGGAAASPVRSVRSVSGPQ
jgi:NAD(P)-dependent dehydrogenase (short-subunit alcohol dehydrogenase family)